MALIIDLLLLAASGAACFYCWILSKRLKALTNTKDGINTGIAALSQSAEDMQNAMTETKQATRDNASHLSTLIEESEKKIPELHELLQKISDISAQTVNDTEAAAKNLVKTLSPHIKDAKESAALLLNSLELKNNDGAQQPDDKKITTDAEPEEKIESIESENVESEGVESDEDAIEFVSTEDTAPKQGEAA